MTKFLIGTGGWAYFHIPNTNPLKAYSKVFNFVEVNTTFYEIPKTETVKSWRRIVPKDFEFTIRCNKKLTHELKFKSVPETFRIYENMVRLCEILNAKILHFLTPSSFNYDKTNSENVLNFFSSIKKTNLRMALENRNKNPLHPSLTRNLQDLNIIHCVDLLKEIEPIYQSDILYTRIFGKGYHNIYQPLDNELKQIDKKATQNGIKQAVITMHSNRMFKDAARFRIYKETGKFPMVSKSTGVDSLIEVLNEDTIFPINKTDLLNHQGWKIIDITPNKRVHASNLIQNLPEKIYYGIGDIIQQLRRS